VRIPRLLLASALAGALVLVGAQSLGASGAAAKSFGARLTKSSQPANAESGRACADEIDGAGACTWVSVEAYRNGGHERAPRSGTIGKVRLVSCVAGSFRLQFAAVQPNQDRARVVRNGPLIRYQADPRQVDGDENTFCGGDEGDDYLIQTFNVDTHVNKGEYIAIRTARTGTLYCSGGSGVLLFSPPLGPGGANRTANDTTSCNLLVQLVYK
jgi:hypothetical protein